MLKKLLCCLICLICIVCQGQTNTSRALYLEFCGASIPVGINFDSRFPNSRFGYRAGLSYTIGDIGEWGNCGKNDDIRGVNVPLEINWLSGSRKKSSHLEIGLGVNVGFYEHTEEYEDFLSDSYIVHKDKMFGYFVFGNLGYRYQRPRGMLFRIGLSPKIDLGGKYGIGGYVSIFSFVPYLSLGYSF